MIKQRSRLGVGTVIGIGMWLGFVVFNSAIVIGIIWAVVHFIRKFW